MTGTTAAEAPAHTDSYDLVVRGRNMTWPDGTGSGEIGVREGRIAAVEPLGTGLAGNRVVTLTDDQTLVPGLVDAHVHVNEPGRTEWEGFATATRAAAAGGITTIIDMPLNSIPSTVTVEALQIKQRAADSQITVDVGFWGGAVPGNTKDLAPLYDEGVFGFKCFLIDSGVPEFPPLDAAEMEHDMAELARLGSLMIVHAEDASSVAAAPEAGGPHYTSFLDSRPRTAENTAIRTVIEAARRTGVRAHILHLSSSDALDDIAKAKAEGLPLTVETCPHYLTLHAEEIADGATACKCAPPIREESNRERLWQGLLDGTIDSIVSDHSPSTVELKQPDTGDFGTAWGGISSLQLGLSLVWTEARQRGIPLETVVTWMSRRPAEIAGLTRKGAMRVGSDADFAIVGTEQEFTVHAARLQHKNPITAYEDKVLYGVVGRTILGGNEIDDQHPHGRFLRHDHA
jgi:allantoinase